MSVTEDSSIFHPTHVLLYAYQRPELTRKSCEAILNWPRLERLVISVDGLREKASNNEEIWRNETIEICREIAHNNSKVEVIVWSDNPGLTNHIFRSISYVLQTTHALIAVEDDNLISIEGLDFLSSRITSNMNPQIAAGFNKFLHSTDDFVDGYRQTLFPTQWTTSLNSKMFSIIEDVWHERKIERSVVKNRINSLTGINPIQRRRLISYWFKYFNSSMLSSRHTDIVVQYATFKGGLYYDVPIEDYVEDIAPQDWRGMNERHNPIKQQTHTPKIYKTASGIACSICDLLGSRIEPSIYRQLFKSIAIRIK